LPIRDDTRLASPRLGNKVRMLDGAMWITVCGTDAEIYEKVAESINHLAAVATPAAHAA
jgi:hypothetical protein